MIRRYVAALTPLDGGAQPTHHDGYAMYAALLEAMGGEGAERLHNANSPPRGDKNFHIQQRGFFLQCLYFFPYRSMS